MPRLSRPLTAIQVKQLTKPGYHAAGVIPGLYVQVTERGSKSWVLRIMVGTKRREIGLGGYPAVPLAEAHERAREARQKAAEGADPVEDRKKARSSLLAAQKAGRTFAECAESFIAEHEPKWTNAKHAAQWSSTLKTYAYPHIGKLLVRDIETAHVLSVIRPIWHTKNETADRVRGRIKQVLDWATAHGYRSGDNPAAWTGRLDKVLPPPRSLQSDDGFPFVHYSKVPAFMADLRRREGSGARALEFLILTAVRPGNARLASWPEVDLDRKVWTIPGKPVPGGYGNRMKGGVTLEVPLSDAAVRLLKSLPRMADTQLLFPSERGKPMSDMTMLAVMQRMEAQAVPHGFRKSFKTWASEIDDCAWEVSEAALGHKLKDKVEATYMRGNWLAKRTALMQRWADFVGSVGKVVPMQRKA